MVDRITLKQECYMQLDGQWQIVLPGSVIDVASASAFHDSHKQTVQTNTGTLASHGKPTPVSNIRTR